MKSKEIILNPNPNSSYLKIWS